MRIQEQGKRLFLYICVGIAVLLLFPLIVPILTYTNFLGFAERIAGLPGVTASGGLTSGVATFAYSLLLVSLIGGVAVAAAGDIGGFGITASSSGEEIANETTAPTPTTTPTAVDTWTPTEQPTSSSQNTETETSTPEPTPTATPTAEPKPTPTSIPTPESTPTATPSPTHELNRSELNSTTNPRDETQPAGETVFEGDPTEWSQIQQYNYTMQSIAYVTDPTVVRWSFNRSEAAATLVIQIENPQNSTRVRNQNINTISAYAAVADTFNDDGNDQDATWIPNNFTITTVNSDGQIYMRSNISYLEALEYNDGSTNALRLLIDFYSRAKFGPANPDICEFQPQARINSSDIDCSS